MKLKKGDNIIVIAGKDKGKSGKITQVFLKENKILVDGMNMKKRHKKARKSNQKGQIIDIAVPFDASNVMLKDPKTNKPTRVGMRIENGKKVRFAKKSGAVI